MPLGDTPFMDIGGQLGGQEDLKRLFYSDPDKSFCKSITIPGGYGNIKAGTAMGIITESTGRLNYHVPYVFADTEGLIPALAEDNAKGFAYLVQDQGGSSEDVFLTMDDSYKFAVGDHVQIQDSDYATQTDCGAITAIDRTTYSHMAKVTVTNTIGIVEVAKGACMSIQTATGAPFVKAVGVLKGGVNTGVGEDAKGGQAVLVIKNAMLYKSGLNCYNDDALADMASAIEDAKYLIM